jgi:hypothetical protein
VATIHARKIAQSEGTTENEFATLLVRTRSSYHHSRPHLAVALDRVRTPIAGNTAHSLARMHLGDGVHTQGQASAKVAGSPPVVHTRLSDHYHSRGCSGPQRIRSGDQRFHRGGWERPPTPGEFGFPSHRRIDHRIWLAPKDYTEGNRVLDDASMVDYTQA